MFRPGNPETKPLSAEKRHKIESNRLAVKIRATSARHLLTKKSYTPNEKEINSFIAFQSKASASRARQTIEVVETIELLLRTHKYSETNRRRLEGSLATFRRSVAQSERIEESKKKGVEEMRKRFGEDAVKKFHARVEQNSRRFSEQWVARWKMNKALYEKYGGRIIFQQAGMEPIDAYRAQLKDIRKKGHLKILKPEYRDVFNELERYLNMGHNYLSENGKKHFNRPYWETADIDAQHKRTIDEYRAIPHE